MILQSLQMIRSEYSLRVNGPKEIIVQYVKKMDVPRTLYVRPYIKHRYIAIWRYNVDISCR